MCKKSFREKLFKLLGCKAKREIADKEQQWKQEVENMTHEELLAYWGITEEQYEAGFRKMMEKVHKFNEEVHPSLKLVMKRKWYDMIENGVKKEEYRDITAYYIKRIFRFKSFDGTMTTDSARFLESRPAMLKYMIKSGELVQRHDRVTMFDGYEKDRRRQTFMFDVSIGCGHERWGAEPGKEYIVLSLGEKMP